MWREGLCEALKAVGRMRVQILSLDESALGGIRTAAEVVPS